MWYEISPLQSKLFYQLYTRVIRKQTNVKKSLWQPVSPSHYFLKFLILRQKLHGNFDVLATFYSTYWIVSFKVLVAANVLAALLGLNFA